MIMKSMTAGLLGTVLLATTALAQTPSSTTGTSDSSTAATSTSSSSSNSTASSSSYQGTWRAGKLAGVNVYNDKNESLGDINDVLLDKSGKAVAVVIGVGGFLGVGERYVAIPFEKVKFVTEPMHNTASNTGTNAGNRPAGSAAPATTSTTTGAATTTAPAGGAMSSSTGTGTGSTSNTAANSSRNPWYPDHAIITGASKDELKAMPEFKYNNS
jgi:sporulation protein YlmC with PRC-barrel domain